MLANFSASDVGYAAVSLEKKDPSGSFVPASSTALYVKLQKAGLLNLLEAPLAETQKEKEMRLRQELLVFLENNGGTRPGRTFALYVKLQKAHLLQLLPSANASAGIVGGATTLF